MPISDPVPPKSPTGWRPWRWVRTDLDGNTSVPFGKIPDSYLPTKEIWIEAPVAHCKVPLPWSTRDAFSEFLPLASTGTIIGALGGLEAASSVMAEKSYTSWGLSQTNTDAPRIAYCIGNLLKEEVYTYMYAYKQAYAGIEEDLIWRSKFKQVHVFQGEIKNSSAIYNKTTNKIDLSKQAISIGVDKSHLPEQTFNESYKITITKSDGAPETPSTTDTPSIPSKEATVINAEVTGINEDGFLILDFGEDIKDQPSIGDFYQLEKPWCIEDPYLMDGFWLGSENEGHTGSNSGHGFFSTSSNKSYVTGSFTGIYIAIDPKTDEPIIPSVGSKMVDSDNQRWYFYQYPNTQSNFYTDSKRFSLVESLGLDGTASVIPQEIATANEDQLNTFVSQEGISFLRLELSSGGSPYQTNFHAPSLINQYVKWEDKYFKILSQVDGMTIDVNIKSVDGSTILNPKSSQAYSIINHYSWMLNEYYMGTSRAQIFKGAIKNISNSEFGSEITVTVSGENMSTWVDLPPNSYKPSYLNPKSFFNRFISTHDHLDNEPIKFYSKGENWILNIKEKTYLVLSFLIPNKPSKETESFDMVFSIEKTSDITDNTKNDFIGSASYISFDYGFKKHGYFNGQLNIACNEASDSMLCMSGFWQSPQFMIDIASNNSYIGICDGRYFGVTDNTAVSNSDATIFITVPGGSLCLSSIYNKVKSNELVIHSDLYSKKTTIRQGSMDYSSLPKKIEISLGDSSEKLSISGGTTLNLDSGYDRLKNIEFSFDVSEDESPFIIALKTTSEYYGFLISGAGDKYLDGITTDPKYDQKTEYKYQSYPCSPVYVNKYGQGNFSKINVPIGINTSDGPIQIINGSVKDVTAQYVKNNQSLENFSFFDFFILEDGELIAIYSQKTDEFSLNSMDDKTGISSSYKNNSSSATPPNKWKYSNNSIMIIGSNENYENWGCPLSKNDNDRQYPLMVMNETEYLTSIYSPIRKELSIISKCYTTEGKEYIGCMSISISSLTYKVFSCIPASNKYMPDKFLWRPVALQDNVIQDENKTYLPTSDYVKSDYSWDFNDGREDSFIRVMGDGVESANIDTSISNFGIMSSYVMKDGIFVVLFASPDGLRSIYSQDAGRSWYLSSIILAKNASSGIIIDGKLFYITTFGIEFKDLNETSLEEFILIDVGSEPSTVELKQKEIDSIPSVLIWTETINVQRFSGYISPQGIYKIFFYNSNTLLTCIQRVSGDKWEVAPNF